MSGQQIAFLILPVLSAILLYEFIPIKKTFAYLIKLNKKCLKDPEQHWWTLVHEVTHLIFEMTGIAFMENNDEEAYVRCVENLVIPWALKHNELRKK